MAPPPYLSVAVGSRNDDHGGNLLRRTQAFVDALFGQCDRFGVQVELVLVDWNPPADEPPLVEAIRWPSAAAGSARIITVSKDLHERFGSAPGLPLHQFIAKNVALRRARGEMVLATNIDVLLSDPLMRTIAERRHAADVVYRADRVDVHPEVPLGVPVSEQMAFCEANQLRCHERDGTRDFRDGSFFRIYRDPAVLKAVSALAPLSFLPLLGPRIDNARRSLRFMNTVGALHTNASGDFTLMARDAWHRLNGYWEFPGFPVYVDGLLCYAAKFLGLREEILAPDACAYHIEHGKGSGFKEYRSGRKWEQLDKSGIARITPESYLAMLYEMKDGTRPLPWNDSAWGLGDEVLPERTPDPA